MSKPAKLNVAIRKGKHTIAAGTSVVVSPSALGVEWFRVFVNGKFIGNAPQSMVSIQEEHK